MNRDDIIRMAQDAGMTPISHVSTADLICTKEAIERFANLVAAAEREACAALCDELVLEHPGRADLTAKQCAFAIRERGAP